MLNKKIAKFSYLLLLIYFVALRCFDWSVKKIQQHSYEVGEYKDILKVF